MKDKETIPWKTDNKDGCKQDDKVDKLVGCVGKIACCCNCDFRFMIFTSHFVFAPMTSQKSISYVKVLNPTYLGLF